ncbi:MAG: hypothetical protein LBT26_04210 [Clostridiales Family XIII bacterium]|jgi:hypothetical protein|nr:hypothetical protein [Clostridiales Family XIII bacterium]
MDSASALGFLDNIWNSSSRYVVIAIIVVIIIYIPFMLLYMRKKKRKAEAFLEQHPEAAKVYITGAVKGTLSVLSINDGAPDTFFEGVKQGFFLLPGENVLELSYSWTRPGVLHKTVTTTIGPTKIKVTAETEKSYHISYDKKDETYSFAEA